MNALVNDPVFSVSQTLLVPLALTLYLTSSVLFWLRIRAGDNPQSTGTVDRKSLLSLSMGWLAVLLHAWLLMQGMFANSVFNISLGYVISLVTWMTVLLFLLSALSRNMINLGVFVMPVGFLGLLIGRFLTGEPVLVEDPASPLLWWHLGIALVAFGFLCIAAAQAILLYLQDKFLHSHHPGKLFPILPSIQTMEKNLFRLTVMGVILLTPNLIIGMAYRYHQEGQPLAFNHHILLSFLAWFGFTVLLFGHRIYGWRGMVAARWTLSAFGILVLAYFGSRFVTSVLLS